MAIATTLLQALSRRSGSLSDVPNSVYPVFCGKEGCDQNILFIVEPAYNLTVGYKRGFPPELLFSETPVEEMSTEDAKTLEGSDVQFWSKHEIATNSCVVFDCSCGRRNPFIVTEDGGLLISSDYYPSEPVNRLIPVECVPFVETPQPTWLAEISS